LGGCCRAAASSPIGQPSAGLFFVAGRSDPASVANWGVLAEVGMKLTGHKTVAMFMHYVHTEDKPVRDAAELVANRRRAITGAWRPAEATA